jgi:hypothetical protein
VNNGIATSKGTKATYEERKLSSKWPSRYKKRVLPPAQLSLNPNFHTISASDRLFEYAESQRLAREANPANRGVNDKISALTEVDSKLKAFREISGMLVKHFKDDEFMSSEYTNHGRKLASDFSGSTLKWHFEDSLLPNYNELLQQSTSSFTESCKKMGFHSVELVHGVDLPWLHSRCGSRLDARGSDSWYDSDFELSEFHSTIRKMTFLVRASRPTRYPSLYSRLLPLSQVVNTCPIGIQTAITFLIQPDHSKNISQLSKAVAEDHLGEVLSVSAIPLLKGHMFNLDYGTRFTAGSNLADMKEEIHLKKKWNGDIRQFHIGPKPRLEGRELADAFDSLVAEANKKRQEHLSNNVRSAYSCPQLVFSCADSAVAYEWKTAFRVATGEVAGVRDGEGINSFSSMLTLGGAMLPSSKSKSKSKQKSRKSMSIFGGVKDVFGKKGNAGEDSDEESRARKLTRTQFSRAERNFVRLVSLLLIEHGSNPTLDAETNAYGEIFDAVWKGDLERVGTIHGRQKVFAAETPPPDSYTATLQNRRNLLEHGTSMSAVAVAAQAGFTDMAKLLLTEVGVHPMIRDSGGEIALHKAAVAGYLDVVNVLLENDATKKLQLVSPDRLNRTALFAALSADLRDCEKTLLAQRRKARDFVPAANSEHFECWRYSNAGMKVNKLHGNVAEKDIVCNSDVAAVADHLWDLCVSRKLVPADTLERESDDCTVFSLRAMKQVSKRRARAQ